MAARHATIIEEHRQSLAVAGRPPAHRPTRRSGTGCASSDSPGKKTPGDDERQTERVQGLRQAFQAEIATAAPEQRIFLDESGVNRAMTRTDARSLRGTRAYASAPRHWGADVSSLGAAVPARHLGADGRQRGDRRTRGG